MARRGTSRSWMGTIAFFMGLAALGAALVPGFQRKEMTTGERILSDVSDVVLEADRHVNNDSRFEFTFSGPGKWRSISMVASVVAISLGLVAISTQWFLAGLAVLLGGVVGAWQFSGLKAPWGWLGWG